MAKKCKNKVSARKLLTKYRAAGVSAFILVTNYNMFFNDDPASGYIAIYRVPLKGLTEELFNVLFSENSNGERDFRIITKGSKGSFKARNVQAVERLTACEVISYKELKNYFGCNFGYKAESYLFGKCNYNHEDLIDGYYNGEAVQVKASILHNVEFGYTASNVF